MTFGERLIVARENKGYKQNQLAELLNITPTRLNYWEKDKREPDVLMIKKISSLLEVSSDWLIGNEQLINDTFDKSEIEHIKKYRSLDSYGQEAVDKILDVEYERCTSNKVITINNKEMISIAEVARSKNNEESLKSKIVSKSELDIFDIAPQSDEIL